MDISDNELMYVCLAILYAERNKKAWWAPSEDEGARASGIRFAFRLVKNRLREQEILGELGYESVLTPEMRNVFGQFISTFGKYGSDEKARV